MDNCGIYSITAPSGNLYIGSSKNIKNRWAAHISALRHQRHNNPVLQKAYNKYKEQLKFKKLLICDPENLLLYEQQYLDFYKPSYNLVLNAASPMTGRKASDETKRKMSIARTGKKLTPEHCRNTSLGKMGKKLSESHKESIRQTLLKRHQDKLSCSSFGGTYG